MTTTTLPRLPYAEWVDTRDTLHLFLQIIGKIRLKTHPKLNHWWHVTLYPSVRGLSTGRIPFGDVSFEISYDMIDHQLVLSCNDDRSTHFDVAGLNVAEFYRETMNGLSSLGINVRIHPVPYENKSTVPFHLDDAPRAYDKQAVTNFWRALCWVASVFETYRSGFNGKQTPVQLYWHSFDLVVTRFSGKAFPLTGGTASDREAYSHEVISVGFWPGDDTFQQAAFYGYAYPEPERLAEAKLSPGTAQWSEKNGGALAILAYDDLMLEADPAATLLGFLDSLYQGAGLAAQWPIGAFIHEFL